MNPARLRDAARRSRKLHGVHVGTRGGSRQGFQRGTGGRMDVAGTGLAHMGIARTALVLLRASGFESDVEGDSTRHVDSLASGGPKRSLQGLFKHQTRYHVVTDRPRS